MSRTRLEGRPGDSPANHLPATAGAQDISAGDVLLAAKRMAQARRRAHESASCAARRIQGLVRSTAGLSKDLAATRPPRSSLGADSRARLGLGSPLTPVSPNKRRTSLDALAAKRKSIDGDTGEGSPLRNCIFDAAN